MVIIDQIKQGVEIFDQTRQTCIATDWSQEGLGYWLSEKQCDCADAPQFCCKSGWKVVLMGSRFTHGAELRYAPIGLVNQVAYAFAAHRGGDQTEVFKILNGYENIDYNIFLKLRKVK